MSLPTPSLHRPAVVTADRRNSDVLPHQVLHQKIASGASKTDVLESIIKFYDHVADTARSQDVAGTIAQIKLYFETGLEKGQSSRIEFPVPHQHLSKYRKSLSDFQIRRVPGLRAGYISKYEELKRVITAGDAATLADEDFVLLAKDIELLSNKAPPGVSQKYWSSIIPKIFDESEAERAIHRVDRLHQEFQWLTYNTHQEASAWLWTWRVVKQMWLSYFQNGTALAMTMHPGLNELECSFFNQWDATLRQVHNSRQILFHDDIKQMVSDYAKRASKSRPTNSMVSVVIPEEAKRSMHSFIHDPARLTYDVLKALRNVAAIYDVLASETSAGSPAEHSVPLPGRASSNGMKEYPLPTYISKRSNWDYVYYPFPETRALSVAHDRLIKRDLSQPGIQSDGLRASDLHNVPPRHVQLNASSWKAYRSNGILTVGGRLAEYLFKNKLRGKKLQSRPTPRQPRAVVPRQLTRRPINNKTAVAGAGNSSARKFSTLSPIKDSARRVSKSSSMAQLPTVKLRGGGPRRSNYFLSYWQKSQSDAIFKFSDAVNPFLLGMGAVTLPLEQGAVDWVVAEFLAKCHWNVDNAIAMYKAQHPDGQTYSYVYLPCDQWLIDDYGPDNADQIVRLAAAAKWSDLDPDQVEEYLVPALEKAAWRWEKAIEDLYAETTQEDNAVVQDDSASEAANDGDAAEAMATYESALGQLAPLPAVSHAGLQQEIDDADDDESDLFSDDGSTDKENYTPTVGQLHHLAGGKSPGYNMIPDGEQSDVLEDDDGDFGQDVHVDVSSELEDYVDDELPTSDKENQKPPPVDPVLPATSAENASPMTPMSNPYGQFAKQGGNHVDLDDDVIPEIVVPSDVSPTEQHLQFMVQHSQKPAAQQTQHSTQHHAPPSGLQDVIASIEDGFEGPQSWKNASLTEDSDKENGPPPSSEIRSTSTPKCHPCPEYANQFHHTCNCECNILDLASYRAGQCDGVSEYAAYTVRDSREYYQRMRTDIDDCQAAFGSIVAGLSGFSNARIHALLHRITREALSVQDDSSTEEFPCNWARFQFPVDIDDAQLAFGELDVAMGRFLKLDSSPLTDLRNRDTRGIRRNLMEQVRGVLECFYRRPVPSETASDRARRGERVRRLGLYRRHAVRLRRLLGQLTDLFRDTDELDPPASTETNHYIMHQYYEAAHDDLLQIRRGLGERIVEREWESSPGFEFYQAQSIQPNAELHVAILYVAEDLRRIEEFFNDGYASDAGSTERIRWAMRRLRRIMYSSEVDDAEVAEATRANNADDDSHDPNAPQQGKRTRSGKDGNVDGQPATSTAQGDGTAKAPATDAAPAAPGSNGQKRKSIDDTANDSASKRPRTESGGAAATPATPAGPEPPNRRDYDNMVVFELKQECAFRQVSPDAKKPSKSSYIDTLLEADAAGNFGMGAMNSYKIITGKNGNKPKSWDEYFESLEQKQKKFGDRLKPE